SQIIPTFARKPLFGYESMVYATASIAFLSMIVWAHHMFTVGMPLAGELFFMYTTMLIAVPTGVKVFNWVATMWRGSLTFETPMLFALCFVILFTIGGFSGLMLAIVPADLQYHDTYFVVAHFHYVLVTGALFAIIGAIYYWWPKWSGRMINERFGQIHFWWSVVFVNLTFFPQHFLGLAGMPRRIPDYNVAFADWNLISTIGAFGMFLTPAMMAFTLWHSLKHGEKAAARAWEGARGLEWTVPSPAPHHTFTRPPVIRPGDLVHEGEH
ncbi:MAG: cbb3-type cytochrome c oxidase subunit I, partial [Xanthomonadales bacterium]|nr:cbb3-type cytochrome c oxidase subunit I [Xanthomonadales bacterium]